MANFSLVGGAAVLALGLAGCALTSDYQVRQLEGKGLPEVVALLGQPNRTVKKTEDGRILLSWFDSATSTSQEWVSTGSNMVGMTGGGGGVAPTPVYQDTGYYATRQHTHTCDIDVYLNQDHVVVEARAWGDMCSSSIRRWQSMAADK